MFVRCCVEGHHPSVVQGPLLGSSGSRSGSGTSLLQVVAALVTDDWYKVIAEALRVLEAVVTAAAKAKADGSPPSDAVVATVFDAVNKRLDTVDIDQEIKDCAINAVGKVASSLSPSHPSPHPNALTLAVDQLLRRQRGSARKATGSVFALAAAVGE